MFNSLFWLRSWDQTCFWSLLEILCLCPPFCLLRCSLSLPLSSKWINKILKTKEYFWTTKTNLYIYSKAIIRTSHFFLLKWVCVCVCMHVCLKYTFCWQSLNCAIMCWKRYTSKYITENICGATWVEGTTPAPLTHTAILEMIPLISAYSSHLKRKEFSREKKAKTSLNTR